MAFPSLETRLGQQIGRLNASGYGADYGHLVECYQQIAAALSSFVTAGTLTLTQEQVVQATPGNTLSLMLVASSGNNPVWIFLPDSTAWQSRVWCYGPTGRAFSLTANRRIWKVDDPNLGPPALLSADVLQASLIRSLELQASGPQFIQNRPAQGMGIRLEAAKDCVGEVTTGAKSIALAVGGYASGTVDNAAIRALVLTSGRVVFATTGGLVTDDSRFTFSTSTGILSAPWFSGGVLASPLLLPFTDTAISYAVASGDVVIGVSNTAAPRTITLPAGTVAKRMIIVKDTSGGAAAVPIRVIATASNIDGGADA